MKVLWNHQVQAIRAASVLQDLGLFFEQGTGKTRTMIEILRRKYADKNRLRKTFILCPAIVCDNWKKEFAMFSKIPQGDIIVLAGSEKERVKKFLSAVGDDMSGNKIVITNYEGILMQTLYKLLQLWGVEIFVGDESQRFKNHEAKRAKAIVKITDTTDHNYILTGTPILNSSQDIFMQFRVLDRGLTFGRNFFSFRNEYFSDSNVDFKAKQSYFPKWEPRADTYEKLQLKIQKKAIRVLKKECLDLPPFVRQTVDVPLSKEQAKAYREMHNDYVTWINSKSGEPRAVVAQLAIVKAMRLQQIVSGFVKDDEGVVHRLPCPRLAVLGELLSDLPPGVKVIIWAKFHENHKMIAEVCEKIGRQYRMITGQVNHKDRITYMDEFRTDPNVNTIIASQGAGGTGINLVEASYAYYYSKDYKLEDDLQSEARNYRGGSEMHEKITRVDLTSPGTIDEIINEALATKTNIGNQILNMTNALGLR